MHIVWLFFLFRCGVDQSHAGQERPEVGVLLANPVFPSRKSTALSNPVLVWESAGLLRPLHPPNATPASLTKTTAAPTSRSPLTRRTCLKWVILFRGERLNYELLSCFPPLLQISPPPFSNSVKNRERSEAWKIRFSSSRRQRSSWVKFSRLVGFSQALLSYPNTFSSDEKKKKKNRKKYILYNKPWLGIPLAFLS